MARLLIKAVDATHPDPAKDKRACYKHGDVVVVREDGHEWSPGEGLPAFLQLDIATSAGGAAYLTDTEYENGAALVAPAMLKIPRLANAVIKNAVRQPVRQRGYTIDLADIVFVDGKAAVETVTIIDKRIR